MVLSSWLHSGASGLSLAVDHFKGVPTVSEASLYNWLKKADVEDGVRPGLTEAGSEELRALKKRNRVLEQEVEILKRAAAYFARELSPK